MFVPNRFYSPITSLRIDDTRLVMKLASGGEIVLDDADQQCCERRYMRTDDDLAQYVGASVVNIVVKDVGEVPPRVDADGYEYDGNHDIQFVDVVTSKGTFTLCSHNEHNGYYGGFDLTLFITSSGGVTEKFTPHNGAWSKVDE